VQGLKGLVHPQHAVAGILLKPQKKLVETGGIEPPTY
jgi:hypothetical protein